ncbi:MAG: glutathione peroxidase [Flavobacteriaceae bacterium]
MKQFKSLLLLCMTYMAMAQTPNTMEQTIYQFKVTDIEGATFDFASLQGKKVMIVNTASKCGYTPQYAELQKVYDQYKDKNFVIIGFPANNFLWQEPGSDQEIAAFCQKNYGVSFPMMSKISVKGSDQHPIYSYLTSKSENGTLDSKVRWNFQKYLIGTDGKIDQVVEPGTSPDAPEIISWIES